VLHRNILGQGSNLVHRNRRKLGGCSKWTIGVGSVTPNWTAHPLGGNSNANLIHKASAITMRNHARIRHAVRERVLPLLDVAWVDTGGGDANANFSRPWDGVRHFADYQHFASRSLLFVPRCLHISSLAGRLRIKIQRTRRATAADSRFHGWDKYGCGGCDTTGCHQYRMLVR
jgi:hypothetical protein